MVFTFDAGRFRAPTNKKKKPVKRFAEFHFRNECIKLILRVRTYQKEFWSPRGAMCSKLKVWLGANSGDERHRAPLIARTTSRTRRSSRTSGMLIWTSCGQSSIGTAPKRHDRADVDPEGPRRSADQLASSCHALSPEGRGRGQGQCLPRGHGESPCSGGQP